MAVPALADADVGVSGRLAFIFPGQGSQRVGMGAELLATRPELYASYLDAAEAASGLPIRRLSLEGPQEELTRTDVAQPALFALSLALVEIAREHGITPDFVAGHSLGEYTAAVAAGVLTREAGFELVAERGRLMAEIQSERPGAMAAIIGLEIEQLRDLCLQAAATAGVVAPANLNTPSQIVVSGEEPAVEALMELAREAGASKVIRLQTGGAFHSQLMEPVQQRLAQTMEKLTWSDPVVALAANASGSLVDTGAGVRDALLTQIASPVRWVDCVRTLIAHDCEFLELGPGRVLCGLIRGIDRDAEATAADSADKLAAFAARSAG